MPPRSRQTRTHPNDPLRTARSIFDLDPTDGLPVQRWSLQLIHVNQDLTPADQASNNARSTTSAEWAAQFNTPAYPWPEQPLPSFFKELPAWNQELIRRARCGQTNAKLSEWDRKTKSWISAADAERKHQRPGNASESIDEVKQEGDDAEMAKSDDDSDMHRSDEEDADKSDTSVSELDQDESPFKPSVKRRKPNNLADSPEEARIIDVKKWTLLPSTVAETHTDRSFLAPRRPGMPPLYRSELTSKLFSQYDSTNQYIQAGTTGYDLGEGGGLANASAVTSVVPQATPTRRNAPPRRKKKKIGGPGRRKLARDLVSEQTTAAGTTTPSTPTADMAVTSAAIPAVTTEATDMDEEALSGSENEGSEEGEIDESPHSPGSRHALADAITSATAAEAAEAAEKPPTVTLPSTSTPVSSTIADLPEPRSPAPPASNPFGDTDEPLPAPTSEVHEVAHIGTIDGANAEDEKDTVENTDVPNMAVLTESVEAEPQPETEADVAVGPDESTTANTVIADANNTPLAPASVSVTTTTTTTGEHENLLDKLEKDLNSS